MGAATPKLIDGAVADGGQQPGTKGALARVKGRGAVPEFEEGLLDDVFRQFRVAQDSDRNRVRERAVTIVGDRQGIDVCRR